MCSKNEALAMLADEVCLQRIVKMYTNQEVALAHI